MSISPAVRAREMCEQNGIKYGNYLFVDADGGSLFLTTGKSGDASGTACQRIVEEALQFSEPLKMTIAHTTSVAGTKHFTEKGFDYSWHFHPDIGLNITAQPIQGGTGSVSPPDELRKWHSLASDGVISASEYELAKQRLLAG